MSIQPFKRTRTESYCGEISQNKPEDDPVPVPVSKPVSPNYFQVGTIKYPNEFKEISDFEEKIRKIVIRTGNFLYEYDEDKLYEDLLIDLNPYGVPKIFVFEDLLNLHLYARNLIEYKSEFSYIENYLPDYEYDSTTNLIHNLVDDTKIQLIRRGKKGGYGQTYECSILNGSQQKYIMKIIDTKNSKDLYLKTLQEIMIHIQLYNMCQSDEFNELTAKIPEIYRIGRIKGTNCIFLVIEKIGSTMSDIFFDASFEASKAEEEPITKKNMIDIIKYNFTKDILLCYHQIGHLLKTVNEMDDVCFVHNDMKPDNILFNDIDNSKEFYLIDFGISNLKVSGFMFINMYPSKINPDNRYDLIQYLYNPKMDIFQILFNTFYFFRKDEIIESMIPFFFNTMNTFLFEKFLSLIIADSSNGDLLFEDHADTYLFRMNKKLYDNINGSEFLEFDVFFEFIQKYVYVKDTHTMKLSWGC